MPYPFAIPETGDPVVRLQIPSIGVDYKVVEGVGLDELKKGPGHFPESVLPGQLGNAAIAGHRTTHGAPFYDVNKLDPGDTIVLTYPAHRRRDRPAVHLRRHRHRHRLAAGLRAGRADHRPDEGDAGADHVPSGDERLASG